ncbi:triacylglycerol lipase 2-like [Quercus robur]|uniref:triacylglycerol lipase 2-like n=1 Tax=Quercus robur TaxID=38942 RepID=UPI002161B13B|nr:triacylglycerol lipase 2-like [Quercus robur]
MRMEYTSNSLLLLLAFLLFTSAGADNSPDSLCKSLVETKGYVCEEHKVTTKDGYILGVQRIPVGRTNKTKANRPPILLQHGLLGDAATWLLNSPNKSFAFILADNGFDVWLGNNRGTVSSRGHTSLSANDPAYWDWTWEQLAGDDLPAMYDYIHIQTGQKLYYVGHSLGTLLAFTAFSQEKLVNMTKSAALLGPIAYLGQLSSVIGRTIITTAAVRQIKKIYCSIVKSIFFLIPNSVSKNYTANNFNFQANSLVVGKLLEGVCALPLIDCNNVLTAVGGPNCCIKPSTIDVLFDHTFQSSSTKNFVHLSQMVRARNIAKYDYGDESENKAHCGQPTPPLYYMTHIPKDIPLFLSYGGKDTLSDVNDVQLLLENLKDHEKDKLVAHFDFIMAENANRVVYDPLLAFFMTP